MFLAFHLGGSACAAAPTIADHGWGGKKQKVSMLNLRALRVCVGVYDVVIEDVEIEVVDR